MTRLLVGLFASVSIAATAAAQSAAPGSAAATPTFARDVAPIMFAKCANCHRAGEVAPMSLLSYQEARPWAKAIKAKVMSREMPPWGANPVLSLPIRNDVSLTDAEIATLAAWADAGAPRGNDADLPAAPSFVEGWTHGSEPDVILEMPVEFEIPAEGELGVQTFFSKIPFTEDKFAEVLELRPGNRSVVHHSGVFVVDIPDGAEIVDGRLLGPDGKPFIERTEAGLPRNDGGTLPGASKLLSWVPGRGVDVHRADGGQAYSRRQVPELAAALQPHGHAADRPLAPGHLVQQGAGDARAPHPSGRRSAGHRRRTPPRSTAPKARRSSTRRTPAPRAAAAPPPTSRLTSRTGQSSASRRSPSQSRSTRCRRTCTCAVKVCAG